MIEPRWVVKNDQRNSVNGRNWPGCKYCGHVYAHADTCLHMATEERLSWTDMWYKIGILSAWQTRVQPALAVASGECRRLTKELETAHLELARLRTNLQ